MEHLEFIGTTIAWTIISFAILVAYGGFIFACYARVRDLGAALLAESVKRPFLLEGESEYVVLDLPNLSLMKVIVSEDEIQLVGIDGTVTGISLPPGATVREGPNGKLYVEWRR